MRQNAKAYMFHIIILEINLNYQSIIQTLKVQPKTVYQHLESGYCDNLEEITWLNISLVAALRPCCNLKKIRTAAILIRINKWITFYLPINWPWHHLYSQPMPLLISNHKERVLDLIAKLSSLNTTTAACSSKKQWEMQATRVCWLLRPQIPPIVEWFLNRHFLAPKHSSLPLHVIKVYSKPTNTMDHNVMKNHHLQMGTHQSSESTGINPLCSS